MPRQTVAISYSAGSGGEIVGEAVAEKLGFRCINDEVIAEAAEQAELDVRLVADAERRRSLVDRILGDLAAQRSPRLAAGETGRWLPTDADLRVLITDVVRGIAEGGESVIVAHAASFALTGRADILRVLVTASPDVRADRVAEARAVDRRAAARTVAEEDRGRADYLKRFYGIEAELPTHFDLVINTDAVTTEAAAELIATAARGLR